jgi:hypothetical protein
VHTASSACGRPPRAAVAVLAAAQQTGPMVECSSTVHTTLGSIWHAGEWFVPDDGIAKSDGTGACGIDQIPGSKEPSGIDRKETSVSVQICVR